MKKKTKRKNKKDKNKNNRKETKITEENMKTSGIVSCKNERGVGKIGGKEEEEKQRVEKRVVKARAV